MSWDPRHTVKKTWGLEVVEVERQFHGVEGHDKVSDGRVDLMVV